MSDNHESHTGSITRELLGLGGTAECTCGWEGEERDTAKEAMADLEAHYASVTP